MGMLLTCGAVTKDSVCMMATVVSKEATSSPSIGHSDGLAHG
jgi:hypothetical protein